MNQLELLEAELEMIQDNNYRKTDGFEIDCVFNHKLCRKEKPREHTGIGSFPSNYDLAYWYCLSVRRLSDGQFLIKRLYGNR